MVLPDNERQGTLEDLLLACGERAYPDLYPKATAFVESAAIELAKLPSREREEFAKAAGPNKATVAAMAALLKPGKSIQVSIQDNAWLSSATLGLNVLKPSLDFLSDLFQPPPT